MGVLDFCARWRAFNALQVAVGAEVSVASMSHRTVIDHVKKHVTFIDFTPTQDWCKHMSYKRFAEAIIMASKKYKIAYNKKRSG